ncbi:DNA polymerase I [Alkalilimnicola ehrlichii MLHE-1]|uniref:DNA polymerase I n=1 Tax=Alkalilimnicola ehrlichii (strain ATCC BAA-1101 / DSM 17681 / MLHE-1) TaxID=187272 RepID=Q0A4N7_ALKEH|nr:DNA polymerase I [Alkalilimnicola ehrlichii]ABI58200.1 DNA polymerase I [Alkalilimnicola ehrlichii MLHE-1]
MSDARKPLILVDGSSYLYRAFHAMPPLTNKDGEPTGAMYGVLNMVRKLLDDYRPERIAVVFDAPGRTFRDELFDQYKAHRPPMPDELRAQIQPLKDIIRAMGLPLLEVPGVEADDVIGTLARQAAEAGQPVVISTGDKDMAQLVDEQVTLLNTMNDTRLDEAGVKEKFGVPPERIIDYLALVGDSSDNIPGVPRVGPKTAAKWLNQFGSLDALKARADEVKGKVGESLRAHLDELALSEDLATIRCDLDLDQRPEDLKPGESDVERLREYYQRYEFRRLLRELLNGDGDSGGEVAPAGPGAAGGAGEGDDARYHTVDDADAFDDWLRRLESAELFAFDLETSSLNYMDAEIVGVALAVGAGEAAYVPLAHEGPDTPTQLDRDRVLAALKPLLEDPDRAKVGQNLKYDMSVLARYDIHLEGVAYDTMLESYVLDSTASRHDMDSLALKYLGRATVKYEDVCGKGAKQIPFAQVAVETATRYAGEDADITLRLHQTLYPRLEAEGRLVQVFHAIEMPLLPVLSRMERHGVKVDRALLEQQSTELAEGMAALEQRAHEEAEGPFNLSSPKQIQEILFERMGLPVLQKTPKGAPSTAESVLEELAARGYELPRLILAYRSLAKLKTTYTDKLPRLIHPKTGRVHTSYHQAVAATGRLSSSDPNLQNIPVRTAEGRRIRKAFVAEPGCKLLAADYSQVELRIMAHLSGDEGLRQAFAEGADIHSATAAEVFGLAPERVGGEQRRAAKAINFGLIYGMSAYGLARQLGIERGEAQAYVDRYFERYPGVKEYMDRTRAEARERGYVETLFGRRLYLPEINARNRQRREYAERTAINAPMQGTAADLIKRAMVAVDAWLTEAHSKARMVMQVHDELVLEVPAADVPAVAEGLRERMQAAGELAVPLEVDVGVADDWEGAH